MKIFGFFADQSKRLMALGVIVLILLTSAFGVVSGDEPEENKELLDCLCSCLEPPGGQFSCCYNTEDRGWSPSCRDLSNGPCICKAYGCFRGPLPTEGECYDNCYAQYAQEKPEAEEGEENHPPTVRLTYYPKFPVEFSGGIYDSSTIHCTANAYDKDGDELKYEWYVDGVKQKDCTRAIVEGSMRAGSHTCKVIVSDGKGGTTRDSVSFTVAEYDVYLEVVAGEVTVNGRQVVKGVKHPLFEGDEIKTSYWLDPGYAILRYADGTQMKVVPESQFVISIPNRLYIYYGGVWVYAKKKDHGFIVHTPSVMTSIKGTEFEVLAEDDGTTTCNVFEGMVDVSDINMTKTVSVNAGETTICEPHGVPSDPEPFDPDSIDRWWESFPFDTIPRTTDVTGLTFESNSNPSGSSVQIPLTLSGIEDKIGNMDITLSYDSSVLEATEVTKGDLTTDSLFEYNILAGTIMISLADAEGFSGNGSIAYVKFNVIGAADSTSPLQIAALGANRADDYEALTIPTNEGVFRVEGGFTVSVSDTTGAKGSTVEVPINLEGASEVGSMDIILTYDANVLSAVDVEAGALGKNALIESNTANDGEVIIALADSSGIDGDGAVAIVAFEVIGDADTTSALTLEEVLVHNLDLGEIIPNTESGTFWVT